MSEQSTAEAHKVVYGVTVTIGDTTKFMVIPAQNKAQAIRLAAEGIISARAGA